MRGWLLLLAVVSLASCSQAVVDPVCETTPQGVTLLIDETTGPYGAGLYDNIVIPLRNGMFDEVIASAPMKHGHIVGRMGQQPQVCKV
jgi:hypothetical protein